VPRLPVAPRADDALDHGWIRTATGQALDLLPLPRWATWPLVPPRGLDAIAFGRDRDRTRTSAIPGPQAAVTSDQRMERMAGIEPAPQGLEGLQAAVTPHSLWFGLRVTIPSFRVGNAACALHTQAERWTGVVHRPIAILRFSKTPLVRAGGRPGIRTQLLPLNGVTARQRTIRSYRPSWRQRQHSEPDLRALETRMLRLHTAPHLCTRQLLSKTEPPCDLTAASFRAPDQNKKGLLGDRPRRPFSRRMQSL
jgi:hypothetical protein